MGLNNYKILANGKDITPTIRDFFVRLVINDAAGIDSDSFELVLADDGKIAFPRNEATMQIYTGKDDKHLVYRGSYTVNSVKLRSPEKQIVLSGDAANLGGSFKTQRDYTWQTTTLKTLVETVAQRNGLTPSVSAEYANTTIEHYIQAGQSDADLVTELATEHGATMKVANKKLVFFPRGDNQSVSGKTLPAVAVHLTDETEAEITLEGTGKFQAVEAYWQAVTEGQKQVVRVGESTGKVKKLSKVYPTQAAAKAAAQSALYREQCGDYKLTLDEMPFVPGIQAERNILLSGHTRKEFNTYWMCQSVREVLDENGHVLSGEFVIPKQDVGDIPILK
ncbi:hypothetical protein HUO09_10160 [Vibrio sp. Y2-5]|uniref:contractile injection system protein, VgrG/Pvc8 family n=1 Tax=Vibrio sp. Y2-5 TaxID=2743977 RepID=UPI0016615193|nr:contractile injection system protein, VgrG/Pvc8 family [Vibrio sp. Y2-5]MBD0786712.1 hypothetical protein [Vibrio sp. Y2-5]